MSEKPIATRSDPEARRAYTRWHYQQNKEAYKARARAKNLETRDAVRKFLFGYVTTHPCVDCGEADPIVLEFDHRGDDVKVFDVGDAIRRGYSLNSVKAEVEKCDVRCANCHRRITYKRAGRTHRG